MKSVIANLDNDWTLTSADIDAFLKGAKASLIVASRLLLTCV